MSFYVIDEVYKSYINDDIDREKLIIPVTNIIQDISDIASKNVKNREMISMLQEKVKSYAETIRDEAGEQARQEEKIEIAKNALLIGLEIEQIEKLTGLNKEKILSLK